MRIYRSSLVIILILLIFWQTSSAQNLNKAQREYFILGTLTDYMGRASNPDRSTLLDQYYSFESPLIAMIDSLLKIDYAKADYKVDTHLETNAAPRSFNIFSKTVKSKLDRYYAFQPSNTFTNEGKVILKGKLKDNIFITDEQKLAFLAGAYVRFGMTNDTAYEISIANSVSKAAVCFKLLAELHSYPSYEIKKNYIPVGHHVFFHPAPKLKEYLNNYLYIRKRIADSLKIVIDKMLSKSDK